MQEMQETWVPSMGQGDPLEKEMAAHSSIPAWKTHGQRSLVGYSPWGLKSRKHRLIHTSANPNSLLISILPSSWQPQSDLCICESASVL